MNPNDIVTYIADSLEQGHSTDSIKEALVARGWSVEVIDQAFAIAQSPPTPAVAPVGVVTQATPSDGPNGPFPVELHSWNWGAFFLNWIWGIANQSYISLLCLIPLVGWVFSFVLGAKGNEWAWNHRKFESIEQFKAVQRAWARWGFGLFVLGFITIFSILPILVITQLHTARQKEAATQTKSYSRPTATPDDTQNSDSTTTPGTNQYN